MSNTTNAYIIFEPDQVLTNDHLNMLFDYLDIQERLTRNKLIGIGIVCGLQIINQPNSINITRGCGVTSKGYLITWDDAVLTQYVSYTLPANPLYQPFVNEVTGLQYELFRMLTDDEAKAIEGSKKSISSGLKDKVVVLFLEANEKDLKNCDTQDCNEKGRQMELTVRPLLIASKDLDAIKQKQQKLSGDDGMYNSYTNRFKLDEIPFKRFDVKATPLADAFDIYDAYLKIVDDATLKNIAGAYVQSFAIFQPILNGYGKENPFKNLLDDLKAKLDFVKKSMPVYIQYYYDFLDDLVKAYQEFKDRSYDIITECCPDEDLFPMHLMLGEATLNTDDYVRSSFRQYFISSPLFNNQTALLVEVKTLFDRMVSLVKNLYIPQFSQKQGVPIRITPSTWSGAPLSERAIPFYYKINNVAPFWSPVKTKRRKWNYNLSYNADKFTILPPENITIPLLYGMESNDFYRIEGHLGQNFTTVLEDILFKRNSNRLPFDVIALKAGADATGTAIKYICNFEDLEAQFKLLRAELACKMHEPLCIVAKIPSILRLVINTNNTPFSFMDTFSGVHLLALQDIVAQKNLVLTSFIKPIRFTKKGDFLKTYCPVKEGTIGFEYTQAINKFFPRPAQIDLTTTAGSKAALMYLIDITEALMQNITAGSTIYNFNYTSFNKVYDDMVSFFTDFMQAVLNADGQERKLSPFLYGMLEAVVTSCMDEKLRALTDEYTARVTKIQQQNLLSEYLKSNPGIDHKAGVPRGGTFIIVYHEAPPTKAAIASAAKSVASLAAVDTVVANSGVKKLTDAAVISKDNLTQILQLFDKSELQLSKVQATALKDLTLQRFAIAGAAKDPFAIQDNTVVADFYLPYICCSDCPPVTYVLPKPPQIFAINPTVFCSNDEQVYTFKTDPAIEDIATIENKAGLKLELDANGKLFFIPAKQAIQQTTSYPLTYNGIGIELKIVASFTIDFKTEPIATDSFTIRFIPNNTVNKSVSWNFGDGSAVSIEQSPVYKFNLTTDPQTFRVSLTATDGPCTSKTEQEITLSKPNQVFSIKPTIFCSNDKKPQFFKADPSVKDVNDVINKDGLKIELDATGNLFFVPANQPIEQNTDYQLTFKGTAIGLKIIAIKGVEIKVETIDTDPFSKKFFASNINGRKVVWNFGDGTLESNEEAPVHTFKISDNVESFLVVLTVIDEPCKLTVEQSVTISKPKQAIFSIVPTAFCLRDKQKKVFKIDPLPADIAEIENPNKLAIDKDDTSGELFFIPPKQNIAQTTQYPLIFKGINLNLTIFVPNAGFLMELSQNPIATVFLPLILKLKAKEREADEYKWIIFNELPDNLKKSIEFNTIDVERINLSEFVGPNREFVPITVSLTVNFNKRTGVNCATTKNYNITSDVLGNHKNKGVFDNLTP
jgi:PKD repeat protein